MRRDERGATAIEYGLVAALVALGVIGSLNLVGGNLAAVFRAAAAGLSAGSVPTSGPPASSPNTATSGG